ncbi:heparinase II/III family protein [Algihabitans albus]|uniref:heparinase II/III family protein n=1 Tax=Algihabitans albus TaxID=2164067 RepID=UPI0013C2E2A9|nr:heparinase II/III family protein [Algihabitans albus]
MFGRLAYAAKRPFFALPAYDWTLGGCDAVNPEATPPDPWPGDVDAGAALLEGHWSLAGQTLLDPNPLWCPPEAGTAWLEEVHGFAWLRDLRATAGDTARRRARELTESWLAAHSRFDRLAWAPLTTSRRLSHWLGQWDFFAASAETQFRRELLHSAARQTRHLARVLPAGLAGADLVLALRGLIIAGACLPGCLAQMRRGLALLELELARQILPDGGQIERSPAHHLAMLRDLIDLRATLHGADQTVPPNLVAAIESMAPMLRLYQHGDGGLALFNGSLPEQGFKVDLVLQRADARRRPRMSAPQSGFQRLQSGRTLIILDAGPPPPPGSDRAAHAGTLAFELSVARERLIVNCGPGTADLPEAYRRLLRGTPAHSTLTLGDMNASPLGRSGGMIARAAIPYCERDEAEGAVWVEAAHDGYSERFGLRHIRRLYLSAGGEDLRGEDRLEPVERGGSKRDLRFAIRFHLHPDVQATLLSGGGALLRLAKAGGWRLRASGAEITLEDSVYHGGPAERRSQQVVLAGLCPPEGLKVKWALRRETKGRDPRARGPQST